MAQLKEDEWPGDGEPTTAEEEGTAFKREGPNPPARRPGRAADDVSRGHDATGDTSETGPPPD